jgi:hypothetical protein
MPRITKENPITNYVSREELNRIQRNINSAVTAQENQKLARIQIMDALQTVVEAFENGSLQETVTRTTRTVYAKAKAALARESEARL